MLRLASENSQAFDRRKRYVVSERQNPETIPMASGTSARPFHHIMQFSASPSRKDLDCQCNQNTAPNGGKRAVRMRPEAVVVLPGASTGGKARQHGAEILPQTVLFLNKGTIEFKCARTHGCIRVNSFRSLLAQSQIL